MFKLNIVEGSQDALPLPYDSHLNLNYLSKYANGKVFIETGTYKGETVKLALDAGFDFIHSVELDDQLYKNAVEMFKKYPNVKIWKGDSIDCLKDIMEKIDNQTATFWLDAHASGEYMGGKSGGSPVVDELNIIKKHSLNNHTIFIDDKRLFGSAEWSYVKEEDALNVLKEINPKYNIHFLDGHVANDVICATVK